MIYTKIRNFFQTIITSYPYFLSLETKYEIRTEEYPDKISAKAANDLSAKYKGFLKNDINKCNGCGDCVNECPSKALNIDVELRSDGTNIVNQFKIDLGKCVFCSLCVDICPVQSIVHTREYERSALQPDGLLLVFNANNDENRIKVQPKEKMKMIRTYEVRK